MSPVANNTLPANSAPGFHLLAKPSGSICNIDSKYCLFLSKETLYPNDEQRMSENTLETYIRQLLESHRKPFEVMALTAKSDSVRHGVWSKRMTLNRTFRLPMQFCLARICLATLET
jgi:uncharacterized protein